MSLKFQAQPNRWSCSVASAAMVMDEPVQDLITRIGHDGSAIVFPDLAEPVCRAGFPMPEIIEAALRAGWSMTPVEACPVATPNGDDSRDVFPESKIKERMDYYFKRYNGLVAGERLDGRYWHNVAWCCEKQVWLDPSGPTLPKETPPIKIATFWVFMKNEHKIAGSFLKSIIAKRPKPLLEDAVCVADSDEPLQDLGPKRFA